MAKILLEVVDSEAPVETKAAAVLMAAVVEGNGIAKMFDKKGNPVFPPQMSEYSDWLDKLGLFCKAIMDKNAEWVSKRGLSRARAISYRLIEHVADAEIRDFFGDALREDMPLFELVPVNKDGNAKGKQKKQQQKKRSTAKQKAWARAAKAVLAINFEQKHVLTAHIARTLIGRLYYGVDCGKFGMGGKRADGYRYGIARESVVQVSAGEVFVANERIITPRHGGSKFTVLSDVTKVPKEVVDSL